MGRTYAFIKIKIETEQGWFEREDETDWLTAKERLPTAYNLIISTIYDVLKILVERDPHQGQYPGEPPPKLKQIIWTVNNQPSMYISNPWKGRLLKHGRFAIPKGGIPCPKLTLPLPETINVYLQQYQTARENYIERLKKQ